MPSKLVLFATCAFIPTAAAQTGGWSIETVSVVSPSNPTTTVEVWAWFDDPTGVRDAFAWGDFDLLAGDGVFSNIHLISGFEPGSAVGNTVLGAFVGQAWGGAGIFANTQNPILFWTVDWTTTDFSPRTVALATRNTSYFNIGTNSTHGGMNLLELYPEGFTHDTGAISVVPSPATALPIALLGTLALGRRRTS